MKQSTQTVFVILFICALLALVWNHLIYLMPVVLHLRTLISGSVPLLAFAVPAYWILNRFSLFQRIETVEKVIFTVFTAWLIGAFVPILLLSCGILSSAVLFVVCGLSLLLSYQTYKRWLIHFPISTLQQAWNDNPTHWRVLFIISLILSLTAALLPPLGYDAHEYHLAAAQQYLIQGYWIWFEYNVYAAFPMNVEMLYLYPLAVDSAAGCTVINLQMALLTAFVVLRLTRMGGFHGPALMPVVLYLAMGIVLRLVVDAKNDLALAMCAALLLYGYEMLRRENTPLVLLLMIGALGFGLGAKYIMILAVLFPFLVMVGIDAVMHKRWDLVKSIFIVCVGGVVLWSPWLIRNVMLYHNPVFPLLTNKLGGTPEIFTALFSAAHASEIYKVNHGIKSMPDSGLFINQLVEFFWLPLRKMILGNPNPMPDALPFGFAVYGLIFPLALMRKDWNSSLAMRVMVFSLACYAIWFFATQRNDRFLASLFPVMALLPCLALATLNWSSSLCKTVYISLLCLVGYQQLCQSISLMRQDTFDYILFPTFEQEFYDKHLPHYRAIAWLNQQQAEGNAIGTVLFVGEAQSYGARFDAVVPTVFNPHLLPDVLDEHVTHILYNAFELNRLDRGYTPLGWQQGSPLRDWIEQNRGTTLKQVYDAFPEQPGNLVVFEIVQ